MPRNKTSVDPVLDELDSIKRLLILILLKAGSTHNEIAKAMNIDRSVVSRMVPSNNVERFKYS